MVLKTEGLALFGAAEAEQQVRVDCRGISWSLGLHAVFLFDNRYPF